MYKAKHLISILAALLTITNLLYAQNGTNSPYTRYGYGDINSISYSGSRAMGGLGIGYRAKSTINPINPASYSNVDTLSFMFDLGGSVNRTTYKSGNEKSNKFNGSFDYITLMFPITKWMGVSLGMNPYATVGYNFSKNDTILAGTGNNRSDETYVSQQTYTGEGGLSQVYLGVSAKFLKHYSLGINAYYLFGNISHYRESHIIPTANAYQKDNLHISDFRFRYGLQYFNNFNNKHDLVIGAIFENKSSLNGDYEFITHGGSISDTIKTSYGFEFPTMYGVGAYYTYNNKISVGADYSFQNWNKTKYYGKTDTLTNISKISVGVEFLPDQFSKKYFNRIRYRAGATLSNSYVKIDDQFNNYSITLGVGIPFRRNASMLNIGFEYGETGEKSSIKENYFKISLSTTFIERWFLKNVNR